MVRGPDDALWFTDSSGIGRVTTSGVVSEFPVADIGTLLVVGPDGHLWFSTSTGLGEMSLDGIVTRFVVGGIESWTNLAAGPDGAVWYTEPNANKVGRITPAGDMTELSLPTPASGPVDIVTGPDGNLWVTEYVAGQVARVTPGGVVTEFRPSNSALNFPYYIVSGPDGALWVDENHDGRTIARVSVTGSITEFTGDNWYPGRLAVTDGGVLLGRNGNMTSNGFGQARIDDAFIQSTFALGDPTVVQDSDGGLAWGPDGHLWFTESRTDRIATLLPPATSTIVCTPGVANGTVTIALGSTIDCYYVPALGVGGAGWDRQNLTGLNGVTGDPASMSSMSYRASVVGGASIANGLVTAPGVPVPPGLVVFWYNVVAGPISPPVSPPVGPAPVVSDISPANGPFYGGNTVTITGTGLAGATSVTIGGVTARIVQGSVSDTSLQVTVPGLPSPFSKGSPADVEVTTPAGTASGTYTYRGVAVVAIRGWTSSFTSGDTDWPRNQGGLEQYLVNAGWPPDAFPVFSYAPGTTSFDYTYSPCATTYGLYGYEAQLNSEVASWAATHPDIDVYLVGHSQGGVIAFGYLAYLLNTTGHLDFSTGSGVHLGGVVTLDSPLGGFGGTETFLADLKTTLVTGCSQAIQEPQDFTDFKSLAASRPAVTDPKMPDWPWGGMASIETLYKMANPIYNDGLALEAGRAGVPVLSIGNDQDWSYALSGEHSSQWLTNGAPGSLVYSRRISTTEAFSFPNFGALANHGAVLDDAEVNATLGALMGGDQNLLGLSVPVPPSAAAGSTTLPISGGTLRLPGSYAYLVVPPGALGAPTTVSINPADLSGPSALPAGVTQVGPAFQITGLQLGGASSAQYTSIYNPALVPSSSTPVLYRFAPAPQSPMAPMALSATGTSGTWTALSTTADPQLGELTAEIMGDGIYVPLAVSPTSLSYSGPTNGVFGEPLTVSATLSDSGPNPVPGQTVDFTLNSAESCSATTDPTGSASCSITPAEGVGTYPLLVVFKETSGYAASSSSASFRLTQATPVIKVSGGPATYDGSPHGATASATGVGGAAVSGSFVLTYAPGGATVPTNAGTYAVGATFTSSDPNYTNATGSGSIIINQAPTSVTYTGDESVVVPNAFTLSVSRTGPQSCPLAYSLNANPKTGVVGTYSLGSGGSVSTSGWKQGAYILTVTDGDGVNCVISSDSATLTVATPGAAAWGTGSYTLAGSGRVSFSFVVAAVSKASPIRYSGMLALVNSDRWRVDGVLSAYSIAGSTGTASGTASLYWWNPALNRKRGGWVLASSRVSYTVSFTESTSKSRGSFGIQIGYAPVLPQPSPLPNAAPTILQGGVIEMR